MGPILFLSKGTGGTEHSPPPVTASAPARFAVGWVRGRLGRPGEVNGGKNQKVKPLKQDLPVISQGKETAQETDSGLELRTPAS